MIRLLLVVIAILSAGTALATRNAPRHSVEWASHSARNEPGEDSDAGTARFFAEEWRQRTVTSRVNDAATGVFALSATLLAVMTVAGLRTLRDIRTLSSPRYHLTIWIAVIGSWMLHITAQIRWLNFIAVRGDLPWWADSIAIGIAELFLAGLLVSAVLVVLLAMSLYKQRLPADISQLDTKTARFWIANAAAGFLVVSILSDIIASVTKGAGLIVFTEVMMLVSITSWWLAAASSRSNAAATATPPAQSSPTLPTAR
jgi:hypothetical protein